jgi:DNA-binding response OmpR family regulator
MVGHTALFEMILYNSILLLEDDLDDQEFFKSAIDQSFPGINCVMLFNGQEGLDYLRSENKPDIIFADIKMAMVNGKQFLKEYHREPVYSPRCPVIMLSTSDARTDIEECLGLGARHYIIKPSSYNDLILELEFTLSRSWL